MIVRAVVLILLLASGHLFGQCPVLSTVSPSSIAAGSSTTTVNFTGNSFQPMDGVAFLPPGQSTPVQLQATFAGANQGTAIIPGSLLTNAGTAQILVIRQSCPPSGVNIQITAQPPPCPTLGSVAPASFTATNANTNLSLTGTNFTQSTQFTLRSSSGSVQLTATITGATQATVVVPASIANVAGTYTITAASTGCGASSPVTFTITPPQQQCPTLAAVSPTTFTATNANVNLMLTGANFTLGTQFTLTGAGGPVQLAATVTSATQAAVIVPASIANAAGTYTITAASTGCGASSPVSFTVTPPQQQCPTLTSTSLTITATNAVVTLTLSGTNLAPGDVVILTGQTAIDLNTTVLSPTQATVVVPDTIARVAGTYQLSVSRRNSTCPPSNPINLTITPPQSCPSLLSVSPSLLTVGSSNTTVTLTGAGLLAGDILVWRGPTGPQNLAMTVVSATQATVTVPVSLLQLPGLVQLAITRPNSACPGSNTIALLVAAGQPACPAVTAISPRMVLARAPDTSLTVTGSNFTPLDIVTAGSDSLVTTFNSTTQLSGLLKADKLAIPGTISITVMRPGSQCQSTQAVNVVILMPVTGLGNPASPANRAGWDPIIIRPICGGGSCMDDDCFPACPGSLCDPGTCDETGVDCDGLPGTCEPTPPCNPGTCGGADNDCGGCDCGGCCGGCEVTPCQPGHCGDSDCPDHSCGSLLTGTGCDGPGCYYLPPIQLAPPVFCSPPECGLDYSLLGRAFIDSNSASLRRDLARLVFGQDPTSTDLVESSLRSHIRAYDITAQGAWLHQFSPRTQSQVHAPWNYFSSLGDPCIGGSQRSPIVCSPGGPSLSVNTWNGNLFLNQPIITLPGQGFPLHFGIFYNSQSLSGTSGSALGTGWTHSFSMHLTHIPDGTEALEGADGTVYYYRVLSPGDGTYTTPLGGPGKLTHNSDGTFRVVTPEPIVYRFDSQGVLTAIFDPKTGASETIASQSGNVSSVNDSNGHSLQFRYIGGKLSTVLDENGNIWMSTQYDAAGELSSVRLVDQSTWRYVYDGSALSAVTNPNGVIAVRFTYDTNRRVSRHMDARGSTWTLTLPSTDTPARVTNPGGGVMDFRYDASGRLIQVIRGPDGPISMSYDGRNNIDSTTDALGRIRTYTYDADNRSTGFTLGGLTWAASYDINGNLADYTDAAGHKTTYTYNSVGLPTQVVFPDGATARATYNAQGWLQIYVNPLGISINLTYNQFGQPVQISKSGASVTYKYNSLGDLIEFKDAAGTITTWNRDPLGRPLQVTTGSGTSVETTRSYQRDANGNVVGITDETGFVTRLYRDLLDRTTQVDRLAGTDGVLSSFFAYDYQIRPISYTDPLNNTTTYTYDARGRLTSRTDPLGNATIYSYDRLGRLANKTDANGNMTTFSYDTFNHLLRLTAGDTPIATYTYDALGNRQSMTDDLGTTTYSYDPNGRLIRQVETDGSTLDFSYDGIGRRISIIRDDNQIARYAYDDFGRMTQATDGSGNTTVYRYDSGRLLARQLPNGTVTDYVYDPLGRPVTVTNGALSAFNYTYDAAGRPVRTPSNAGVSTYEYDGLGRVVRWTDSGGNSTTYAWDGNSRRISASGPAGATSYSYDAAGRLVKVADTTLSYDNNGNLVFDGSATYRWDALNRLIAIDGPFTVQYRYDGNGRRISQQTPAGLFRYRYDPLTGQVLEEIGPDGEWFYFYGLERISLATQLLLLFYYYDGFGNVAEVADRLGAILEEDVYDPFGVKLSADPPSSRNKYHFRGLYTDPLTGFLYVRGRYYNPTWGVFLNRRR